MRHETFSLAVAMVKLDFSLANKNKLLKNKSSNMNRITLEQKQRLLDFVEVNFNDLFGFVAANGHARRAELWGEISRELNEGSSCPKTVEQWKRAWQDMKKLVKRKLNKHRAAQNVTGGGEFDGNFNLTQEEQRIIAICGLETLDGARDVAELGQPENETPPSPEFSPFTASTSSQIPTPSLSSFLLSPQPTPSLPNPSSPILPLLQPSISTSSLPSPSPVPAIIERETPSARRARLRSARISEILPPRAQRQRDDRRAESVAVSSVVRSLQLQEEAVDLLRQILNKLNKR